MRSAPRRKAQRSGPVARKPPAFSERSIWTIASARSDGSYPRAPPSAPSWHGQVWNASELGRSLGASDQTARHYLDVLQATFVAIVLQPYHANLGKRQVKSPKVYVADSGLLHSLLGIEDERGLRGHPKAGASFEGFALQAILDRLGAREHEAFFWGAHSGPELDLLVVRGRRRLGFEFKLTGAPELTASMRTACEDLELQHLWVVHAGKDRYRLAKNVDAIPLTDLEELEPL